ncbi:hypothetical protein B0T10DRAFT_497424 [Thelonectria olida]|uniref:Uncharacterized protein n=1 Tax=Thelonectria olida TaxID=1576542 RepID=A0A9P8VW74_9HYPO|nr:hypothetical protein B0T10DRAFT_497424 [Thelonectria olida]
MMQPHPTLECDFSDRLFMYENPGQKPPLQRQKQHARGGKSQCQTRVDTFLRKFQQELDWSNAQSENHLPDNVISSLYDTLTTLGTDFQDRANLTWEDIFKLCQNHYSRLKSPSEQAFFKLVVDGASVVAIETGQDKDMVDRAMKNLYSLPDAQYSAYASTKRVAVKYAIKIVDVFASHYGCYAYTLPYYGEAIDPCMLTIHTTNHDTRKHRSGLFYIVLAL